MKKIYFILIIFLFLTQSADAQVDKKALSYKEFSKLDKSLKGNVVWYLFLWVDGYYSGDLEFTTDINKLFDFKEDDAIYVPVKIQRILQENKQSFQLEQTDTSLTIYYDGHFIMYLSNTLTCASMSERKRDLVYLCDESENFIYDEGILELFQADVREIYKKFIQKGYTTVLFPVDTITYFAASNRPLIVAYQYDKEQGLSIHKICACKYELLQNSYTKNLAELAEKYCEKYNLSKIIFAARVLKSKEDW